MKAQLPFRAGLQARHNNANRWLLCLAILASIAPFAAGQTQRLAQLGTPIGVDEPAPAQVGTPVRGDPPAPSGRQLLSDPPLAASGATFFTRKPESPGIYGQADVLLWWTRPNALPPLLSSSPPGTSLADAGILGTHGANVVFGDSGVDGGLRVGGRFVLGGWLTPDNTWGAEVNFLFLDQRGTNFSLPTDGSLILGRPFFDVSTQSPNSLLIGYPGLVRGSFSATTATNFIGAGFDLRRALLAGSEFRLDLLAGYRYLRLHESLNINETEIGADPTDPAFGIPILLNDHFATTNQFHGGELGLDAEFRRGRWSIGLLGKVGLGANLRNVEIGGSTQVTGQPADIGGFLASGSNSGSYHSTGFAVVPEVGLKLGCQITDRVRATVGYSGIYWTGVARPGNQVDLGINPTQFPPGTLAGPARPAFRFNNSDFWAQGINFGLEITY